MFKPVYNNIFNPVNKNINKNIDWRDLSRNPNAIPLLKKTWIK